VFDEDPDAEVGLIAYGGTHWALVEARDVLRDEGIPTVYCRVRALPVSDQVTEFIARFHRVYVIEQNRDAQLTSILRANLSGALADRLIPITHYNGTPIAAENIVRPILRHEQKIEAGWLPSAEEGDESLPSHTEDVSSE